MPEILSFQRPDPIKVRVHLESDVFTPIDHLHRSAHDIHVALQDFLIEGLQETNVQTLRDIVSMVRDIEVAVICCHDSLAKREDVLRGRQ